MKGTSSVALRGSVGRAAIPAASIALAVAGPGLEPAQAQQDRSEVVIETIELEPDLFVLVGRGGNIGLSVGDDGAFLIDDQYAQLTEKILAAVAAVTNEPVRWVLNTHWHGDHTGGNENLGKAGAMIVAHENVYRRMNPARFADLAGRSNQAPPAALPVVSFDHSIRFHWNGRHLHVAHIPAAHTDGDALVHFPRANVFHMGDTFLPGRYPFVDVDSGGDIDGVIAAANFVLERADADTRIIPGHGRLASPEDLRAYRDMLETVRLRVARLLAAGRTEDETVAAQPTADLDETWGGGGGGGGARNASCERCIEAWGLGSGWRDRTPRRSVRPGGNATCDKESTVTLPKKRDVDVAKFNRDRELPFALRIMDFQAAIQDVYLSRVDVRDFRKNSRGELGTRTATLHREGIKKLRQGWIYLNRG